LSSNEENKKRAGDYYRGLIAHMEADVMRLQEEKEKYGRFRRFVMGINRNQRNRRRQANHYRRILDRYIRQGWAI